MQWKVGGFLYRRDRDGVLQAYRENPNGDIEAFGVRWTWDHEATKEEELKVDPVGALGYALGLTECPYHPGVWLKPGEPCPVCLEEAVQAALGEAKDRGEHVEAHRS